MYNQINTYKSVSNPTVHNTITIDQWFNLIKTSDYSQSIIDARNGIVDYDATKASLPCVTYNFNYSKYKKDSNIIDSTGLIYIDIDASAFDVKILDKSKIFAYYKSFGGLGYSILVQAKGITKENFKSAYQSIITELEISQFIDFNAVKHSQFSVLSFDPNIYINYDSYVFDFSNLNFAPLSIVNKKKKAYTTDGGAKSELRYDDTNEIIFDGDYITNWDGYTIVKAWIPIKKIQDGCRYKYMLAYATNLLYLNGDLSFHGLLNNLKKVNPIACLNPIAESQLQKIVKTVFKQRYDNAGLQPIPFNKKRKIVFKKGTGLTKDDKLAICRSEIASHRSDKSKQKIYEILEAWDFNTNGKITQRSIYKNYKITKKTVEKYWPEFKQYITELNNQHFNMESLKKKNYLLQPIEGVTIDDKADSVNTTITAAIEPKYINKQTDIMNKYDKQKDIYTLDADTSTATLILEASKLIDYFKACSKDSTELVKNRIRNAKIGNTIPINDYLNDKIIIGNKYLNKEAEYIFEIVRI